MAVLAGEGCTLGYSADGTSYSAIAQVVSIDGPSKVLGEVETTNLGSTTRTYRAGLPESGTMSFQVYYDPATHSTLEDATGEIYLQLTMSDGSSTYSFPCIRTGFSYGGMEVDGNVTADVEVRLTGDIT
ncbi:phage tail tube protein [Gimesia maris]|uniref:phage tail tube protein n=1 Tax=Gimesia maris TaxID=122 RepID=UPI0030D7A0B4|tara:strand:- start:121046 stop:121432 length:387 start_codon:yes stop_codon:yes gene_type:complete